ncbi:hypothetical protein Mal4_26050 [Maioricimonas rarisocia]|uniref:Uncharacterized protein n=1 Tax=Maioricimonas rarisocia TaxID=2528026 RepID=A0A517Z712_9PLAN|nr:hypothetical protein [Maioricimonas rarisocia]QDU38278.1 hypothetical protein Mal4_26050 [Maioricimonas rarisocia]
MLAVTVTGPAGTALFAEAPEAATPLERLRQRSADDRWRALRDRYATQAPADASDSGELERATTAHEPSARQVGGRDFGSWQKADRTPVSFEPAGAESRDARVTQPASATDPFEPAVMPGVTGPASEVNAPLELPAFEAAAAPLRISQENGAGQPAPAPGGDTPLEPIPDDAAPLGDRVPNDPSQYDDASRFVVLKPINAIKPFVDYSPDGSDPCENLCPRPDGAPCEDDATYKQCPQVFALPDTGSPDRYFAHSHFYWAATNLSHNPLYFEDPSLERYGHVFICEAVQPFVSVGKFGAQLAGLPYQMALHPPHSEEYVLGWYRPGDWAPKKIYQVPLNAKAAAVTAATYTGLIFLFP